MGKRTKVGAQVANAVKVSLPLTSQKVQSLHFLCVAIVPFDVCNPCVYLVGELFKAGRHFHYVIGVCDEEHGQKCPLFPGVTQRIYWSFPDPATFTGSQDEKLARVIEVREALRARIESWLATLSDTDSTPRKTTRT